MCFENCKYILKNISFIFLILGFSFSCKKSENRKCWKSAGNEVSRILSVNNFKELLLKKGLSYELIQDSLNQIEIIGGKNLVNLIEVVDNNDTFISVENKNKCNFLRKYSKNIVKVKIHFKQLDYIRYEGTDNLISIDTLRFGNFRFESIDACGTSNLTLIAQHFEALAPMGNSNFNIYGEVESLKLDIRDYSFCNTTGLKVKQEIEVINESFDDIYINAQGLTLKGKIIGNGNIYYSGEIISNEIKTFSGGRVIKL